MEVQDGALLEARDLSGRLEAARSGARTALALAVVLATAAVVIAAQPLRSPWWTYADADATYTGAALNLVAGHRASFVDHPGLPVTEVTALVFAADALAHGALSTSARRAYADERLLDLDDTRGVFRGLAAMFYALGAIASVVLATWYFRDWAAGLAGGLFWIGAPGLMPMSTQLRPDVLLGACCVAFAYLVAAAARRRAAGLYAAAAAVAGAALMMKIHAIGLVAPLALAVLWRPPATPWLPGRRTLAAAAALGAAAVIANVERLPYTPTTAQAGAALAAVAVFVTAATVAAGSWRAAASAGVVAAYAAGVLLPVVFAIPDGLQALVLLAKAATGQGVSDVQSFVTPLRTGLTLGGMLTVVVLAGGLAAALLGLGRRDPAPVLWAVGAAALLVLAWGRPVATHYLAPGYLLAVPAVIWLAQRLPRRLNATVVLLAALAAWPAVRDRSEPAVEAAQLRAAGEAERARVVDKLRPGDVAIAPSYFPDPDVRYFELVQLYVDHSPRYPYRVLPATEAAATFAREQGLRPAAAIRGAELP